MKKIESISVVIPAYNESERIKKTLERICNYLNDVACEWEIIVVDDGSTDTTFQIVKECAEKEERIHIIKNERNMGKGYSVKRGVLQGKGKYILFSDADLSAPIEELEKLIKYLSKGYDIAIGSRGLPASDIRIHQPWYRERMGKIFNLFVQILALPGIWDTQCGFKCFKREVAHKVFKLQRIHGFAFDVEVLYIARKFKYKTKEIPIQWMDAKGTKVHPIKDAARMLFELIHIRINDIFKKCYCPKGG
jgi:dolichyl-phosphate beta-glucosyltransferase